MEPSWPADAAEPSDSRGHTFAEVDAAVRTQRRVAVGYFGLLLGAMASVPLLAAALPWWTRGRLLGGLSPNFAFVAFGIYALFVVIAVAAATLAAAVEERMLGDRSELFDDDLDGGPG